ncbi:MAG: helix-turn-helix transcriptional regulator [Aureispira sp.]|nr:helix-turn-helix transcriptional regulator [Aureispira sp.]
MNQKNHIHLDQDWGLFIGTFNDNQIHQHYAVQLSIALDSPINIKDKDANNLTQSTILIKSNVVHLLQSEHPHLLLLFNPSSPIGYTLQCYKQKNIAEFDHKIAKQLRLAGQNFLLKLHDFSEFIQLVKKILSPFALEHYSIKDERLKKALDYLFKHHTRVISLDEIASYVHLSSSRFLHLFKTTTSISFRRYQLWNKIQQSLPYLNQQSITKTAYQFGFSDSAHYTRTFKQNFGFSPKFLSKQ